MGTYLVAVRTLSKNNVEALARGRQRAQPLEMEKISWFRKIAKALEVGVKRGASIQ